MADIYHQFPVKAPAQKVFDAFCTSEGLDSWWPQRSSGTPAMGNPYTFFFSPEYDWRAEVSQIVPGKELTWKMTQASPDWMNTHVGFKLEETAEGTTVEFFHKGWPHANEHYRISNFCWAILLFGLKQYVEKGVVVPFEQRQ